MRAAVPDGCLGSSVHEVLARLPGISLNMDPADTSLVIHSLNPVVTDEVYS